METDSPTLKAPVLLLDREFDEHLLRSAPALELRNIGAKIWKRIIAECGARDLTLYHLTVPSIEGIQRLEQVRALKLHWASKITSLDPLFAMTGLEALSIVDAGKVRSIAGIERLTNLRSLELSGNPGSLTPPLSLETLRPLTGLPKLERLSLSVLRLGDDDITCIACLRSLRSLGLSNQFEKAQVAYLAKQLNAQLEVPILAYAVVGRRCPTCGAALHMFRGRRQPFLCRSCHTARFDKLVEEFERMVAAA